MGGLRDIIFYYVSLFVPDISLMSLLSILSLTQLLIFIPLLLQIYSLTATLLKSGAAVRRRTGLQSHLFALLLAIESNAESVLIP
jgi:hypothetical protein